MPKTWQNFYHSELTRKFVEIMKLNFLFLHDDLEFINVDLSRKGDTITSFAISIFFSFQLFSVFKA